MSLSRDLLEAVLHWDVLRGPYAAQSCRAVRSLLLDHIAVAAWGARSDVARIMREHATGDLAGAGPQLPIMGTDIRTSAVAAAMANAVAAACYEFDDTHTGASAHPGAVIFPAALAAGALSGCDEHTFVRAAIVGYEVMVRVALAASPMAHRARHFHPTSTAGHFGAAAAAAVCLGLDLDRALAAVSLAGTVAGGSMQFLVEGAVTKQLHPAYAVQRGVQAALLAQRGFPGLADPIAGTRGFLAGHSGEPRPERLVEELGTRPPEITRTGIKPYPSCRNTQTPVDALFALLARHPVRTEDVAGVRFGLIRNGVATVWEPPARTRRPRTLADAQFSMAYVAAMVLLDRELGPAQFSPERYADPAVCALMDRVSVVHDPALDEDYPRLWPAWVEITTTDGTCLRERADCPKGDPGNPLSDGEIGAKLIQLTRHCYDGARRSALVRAVQALPGPGTLETIFRMA